MKYTHTFTLEFPMKKVREYLDFNGIPKKEQQKMVRDELRQCCCGIVDGDRGGHAIDWTEVFLRSLIEQGATPTEKFYTEYGRQ